MLVSPPNSHAETLTPTVMVSWDGSLGGGEVRRGEFSWLGLVSLWRDSRELSCAFYWVRLKWKDSHHENGGLLWTGKHPPPDTAYARPWSGLHSAQSWEKYMCVVAKPSGLCYFCCSSLDGFTQYNHGLKITIMGSSLGWGNGFGA